MTQRRMHLIGYLMAGPTWHLYGGWRHPESDGRQALDPARYETVARILEAGKFDGVFFVDFLMLFDAFRDGYGTNLREAGQMCLLEPMQLLSAMARVTSRIGLAATMSTTLYPPYHIARAFASLDHISSGRAGWNVVTSAVEGEAMNYGLGKLLDKRRRYDHADDVMQACDRLWTGWEEDALLADAASGVFADPTKVHYANYQGEFVSTRGPLNTPRSPQTRPVILQAGSSPRGRQFAGRWAEAIFTLQSAKADMQAFYADIKARLAEHGRPASHCAVLPGIDVVLGETEAEAQDRADSINAYANPSLGLAELSAVLGFDLSAHPPQTKIATLDLGQTYQGLVDVVRQKACEGDMTIEQAGLAWARNQMVPQIVGTPAHVADVLEDYFSTGSCDGFMLCPSLSPGGFMRFVKGVVPELQRRGLFRTEYQHGTFRANLQS